MSKRMACMEERNGITVITPTCDRPIAFQRCNYYFNNQLKSFPVQWIVIDSGINKIKPKNQNIYISIKCNQNKNKDIAKNYLSALDYISFNIVVFMEDDDWYANDYLKFVYDNFDDSDIVGCQRNKYYNVTENYYFKNGNFRHSSLCSTAISKKIALNEFKRHCEIAFKKSHKFIDLKLWRSKVNKKFIKSNNKVIGMKCLPGKKGLAGHRIREKYLKDNDLKTLYSWLPKEDADWYATFSKNKMVKN